MNQLIAFLGALAELVRMKNGGTDNDVSKLLDYAKLGARAGDTGKRHLEKAVAVVQQLVAEDRALTDQELADLDASIRDKLARAAGVQIPADDAPPTSPPVVDPVDPENSAGTTEGEHAPT